MEFFATCPVGFEDALADELRALELPQVRKLKGRVSFAGEAVDGERACLWSRLASRVLVVLGRFECRNADELYAGTKNMPWEEILAPGVTIAVSAHGTNDNLRNTRFSSLRVKDGICDHMLEATGARPSVDTEHPGAHIVLALRGERATLQLDLSGEPLFKRLPREATEKGAAYSVLRPDYAALALAQVEWGELCREQSGMQAGTAGENARQMDVLDKAAQRKKARVLSAVDAEAADSAQTSEVVAFEESAASSAASHTAGSPLVLVDPHCAGGGIVLEASLQLLDRAPGLLRAHWGFMGWHKHDEAAWATLLDEADTRAEAGANRAGTIVATDLDSNAISFTQRVLAAAGVANRVITMPVNAQKIVARLGLTHAASPARGAIVCDASAIELTNMGRYLRFIDSLTRDEKTEHLPLIAIARDNLLAKTLGTTPARSIPIKPGNEDAQLLVFKAAGLAGVEADGAGVSESGISAGLASAEMGGAGASVSGAANAEAPASAGAGNTPGAGTDAAASPSNTASTSQPTVEVANGVRVPVLIPESDQFAARLRKVAKQRRKWARRAGVTCYRVYDADLPDYAAAIDLYEGAPETPGPKNRGCRPRPRAHARHAHYRAACARRTDRPPGRPCSHALARRLAVRQRRRTQRPRCPHLGSARHAQRHRPARHPRGRPYLYR